VSVSVFREGAEQERCSAAMPVRADADALRGVSDEVMAIAVCNRKITGTLYTESYLPLGLLDLSRVQARRLRRE
jgi:hypothetical protein